MHKRYYLIGLAGLMILIVGYHFYAASQAEQQLDEAIQKQAQQHGNISAQYSSIDVTPFAADITVNDWTVIFNNHIQRANRLSFDISYLDVLNIYFGGLKYGLKNLTELNLSAIRPSYTISSGIQEVKSDTLTLSYQGNALDLIQQLTDSTNRSTNHNIKATFSGFTTVLPGNSRSSIKARHMQYQASIPPDRPLSLFNIAHQISAQNIVWSPTSSQQQKYSFIIKGLGYPTDTIPFKSFNISTSPTKKSRLKAINWILQSELALISSSGFLQTYRPIGNSAFQDTRITITDLSPSFQKTLENIETLFSFSLPKTKKGIQIPLQGTIADPSISLDN
ncbi:hypothetical protein LX73_2542 [Fodinibius salinus]|uniref:Uncharacterized protein n=1 Tax=Fodinibius salinus TaxID=860790 RepID=A0A5D3YFA7_9BACT|nr:DUF945 domain-containing protein [Fodinibius salinus]TYP91716.1 hypothetical protein LX73_2542 [Fodinibius salinus]